MNEIEFKILEVNREELEKKLFELGAKKIFDDVLEAFKIDSESDTLKNQQSLLRLRKQGENNVITFKKILDKDDNVKTANELEVSFSDMNTMKKIFENLGFVIKGPFRKHRVSYKIAEADVRFDFDKYLDDQEHVPEFLEIESEDKEKIFKYAELLGFAKDDCKGWSGFDVVKHYKKNN
jgi:adenylate cyclase class 2